MRSKLSPGLTLVELSISLAASAIAFGIAVPIFSNMIDTNRVAGQINALRGALALTRSEAIRRNIRVVLCKSDDGNGCTRQGPWDQGWIVFEDRNQNHKHDTNESLLLVQGKLPNGHQLKYRGFRSHNYIEYQPSGFTKMNGTFVLCSLNSPERSKALILTKSGRVRLSTTRADGAPLDCPNAVNSSG
jgi:type IV fimbrial biogenesis protein FimT